MMGAWMMDYSFLCLSTDGIVGLCRRRGRGDARGMIREEGGVECDSKTTITVRATLQVMGQATVAMGNAVGEEAQWRSNDQQ